MKRRELLHMGTSALLTAGLWPGQLRAAENGVGDNFSFIVVNDLHFKEEACGPWFERIVATMKTSAPDAEFCLLGGDLANDGTRDQLAGAHEVFKKLGLPLYATPGNHDYLTDSDRKAYDEFFAGQLNQTFIHRGWQILGLDSSDGTRYQNIKIQPPTLQWLDENLPKLDKAKPTLVWTHFPLGAGVTYRPTNADALLERFFDFNLQAVFSGHWHGFTEKTVRGATLTTNRCCSRVRANHDKTPQKGWFVCDAKDGKITRRFVEIPAG